MTGALSGLVCPGAFLAKSDCLRAVLLASAAVGLGACASNPPGAAGPAPIDFRGSAPVAKVAGLRTPPPAMTPPPIMAPAAPARQAVAPPSDIVVQRVVDVGVSPTGASAIEEARAMRAEAGLRPGGTLRQVRDNPSARAIEVQPTDTLYDISRRYSVNMRALIETNALEPPYALSAGDVVYLPPPNVHIVESGRDALFGVAPLQCRYALTGAAQRHRAAMDRLSGRRAAAPAAGARAGARASRSRSWPPAPVAAPPARAAARRSRHQTTPAPKATGCRCHRIDKADLADRRIALPTQPS